MSKPRLLDLFCGAGGCSKGYAEAGFEVVGVDIKPQKNYPFEFHQANALEFSLDGFDVIHASPPCQAYCGLTPDKSIHPKLIVPVRERLANSGALYVIENVEGARHDLLEPIKLCGSSFDLDVRRHRYFESNAGLQGKPCEHHKQTPRFISLDKRKKSLASVVGVYGGGQVRGLASVVGVHGNLNYAGELELRQRAMGINWMSNKEITQAIPPAYTTFIGEQLTARLRERQVA